jgi:uncharacterized membrane protein YGL010W
MRSVTDWLGEYGLSHQNPVNKLLHWICVPPIVLAVMGLLWSVPVPAVFADVSPWLNWATLAATAALVYYLLLSPALAVGVLIAFIGWRSCRGRCGSRLWWFSSSPGSGSSWATRWKVSARRSSRTCSFC